MDEALLATSICDFQVAFVMLAVRSMNVDNSLCHMVGFELQARNVEFDYLKGGPGWCYKFVIRAEA